MNPQTQRYGLVDMGTQAIRWQIVEVNTDGTRLVLQSEREPVRLGSELFQTGSIPEPVIADAAEVFVRFRDACTHHGVERIRAIATAAAREARNGQELLRRIEQSSGIAVEVITGEEEARLLFRAIESRLDLTGRRTLVADVGGGSVELLAIEDGHLTGTGSFPYGALRLLAAMVADGTRDDPQSARAHLGEFLEQARRFLGDRHVDSYVITGGGSTSLANLLQKRGRARVVEGVESYPTVAAANLVEELARMSLEERLKIPELPDDRADTVVAGGTIYLSLARLVRADHLLVPRVGLRDGMLLEISGGAHA